MLPVSPAVRLHLRRLLLPALLFGLGLALTVAAARGQQNRHREARRARFDHLANQQALALRQRLQEGLLILSSLADFFAASREVERGEFHDFVQKSLDRDPTLLALEWAPRAKSKTAHPSDVFPITYLESANS